MINRDIAPREPTSDECTGRAKVGEHATAFWFPQMGGYTARAVAVVDPVDCCIDVWVWHNGEFPFTGESCLGCGFPRSPMRIHATSGFDWIRMGEFFDELEEAARPEPESAP